MYVSFVFYSPIGLSPPFLLSSFTYSLYLFIFRVNASFSVADPNPQGSISFSWIRIIAFLYKTDVLPCTVWIYLLETPCAYNLKRLELTISAPTPNTSANRQDKNEHVKSPYSRIRTDTNLSSGIRIHKKKGQIRNIGFFPLRGWFSSPIRSSQPIAVFQYKKYIPTYVQTVAFLNENITLCSLLKHLLGLTGATEVTYPFPKLLTINKNTFSAVNDVRTPAPFYACFRIDCYGTECVYRAVFSFS